MHVEQAEEQIIHRALQFVSFGAFTQRANHVDRQFGSIIEYLAYCDEGTSRPSGDQSLKASSFLTEPSGQLIPSSSADIELPMEPVPRLGDDSVAFKEVELEVRQQAVEAERRRLPDRCFVCMRIETLDDAEDAEAVGVKPFLREGDPHRSTIAFRLPDVCIYRHAVHGAGFDEGPEHYCGTLLECPLCVWSSAEPDPEMVFRVSVADEEPRLFGLVLSVKRGERRHDFPQQVVRS